jgi:hypothetical protein
VPQAYAPEDDAEKTERNLPGVRVLPETAMPSVFEKENVS